MAKLRQEYGLLIAGVALGVLYGLFARIVMGEAATLVSLTFLFIVPFMLGIVPMMFADEDQLKAYKNIIFIPWLTVGTFFMTMFLLRKEDMICLLILAAPFFILATLGAYLYRVKEINRDKDNNKMLTLSILLLPFLLAPLEQYISKPSSVYTIESSVVVNATPEEVWKNIVEVKTIQESEYNAGVFNKLGVPRPISATVDKKALGGHRTGNFEGGLKFVETITQYDLYKKVAFDITVDPKSIRPAIFDQHVLNGNYFTFVDATYEIVPMKNGQVTLKLSSNYQLSTTVNFYGKFWGDLLLEDFQDRLLEVIQHRCEELK